MGFPAVTYAALSGEGGLACGGALRARRDGCSGLLARPRKDGDVGEMRRGSEPLIPPVGDLLPIGEGDS